jgi:hypothetical protein
VGVVVVGCGWLFALCYGRGFAKEERREEGGGLEEEVIQVTSHELIF